MLWGAYSSKKNEKRYRVVEEEVFDYKGLPDVRKSYEEAIKSNDQVTKQLE